MFERVGLCPHTLQRGRWMFLLLLCSSVFEGSVELESWMIEMMKLMFVLPHARRLEGSADF